MIRFMAFAAFALVLATSAQAMSLVPLHQSDGMITQVREACGAGYHMVNGSCHSYCRSPERREVCGWNAHSRWPLRQIIECTWRQLGVGFGRRPFTFRGQSRAGCDKSAIACEAIEGYSRSWPFVLPNVLWQTQPRYRPGLFLHLLLNTAAHVRASLLFCAEGIRVTSEQRQEGRECRDQ